MLPTRRSFCIAVALLGVSSPLRSQDSSFVKALRTTQMGFSVRGGALVGEGAAFFTHAAHEHQFMLVGEDHGIREVPEFVGALFTTAASEGYAHLAVEIGPVTGRAVERMMRGPAPLAAVDSFLARHTAFTLPFFFWREESAMLERVVGRTKDAIWGIDQEFMIAPSFLLERLVQAAPNASARVMVQEHLARSVAGDRALMEQHNPGNAWILNVSNAALDSLSSVLAAKPESEAAEILSEITASRHIYQTVNSQNQQSNQERADLMKRHFLTAYRKAQRAGERVPKVLVKLGANHVFRGPSITGTYEMGSFLPELGTETGGGSFGILLVVARGTANAYRPFGSTEADKTRPYDLLASEEYKVFDMASVLAAAGGPEWTAFDVRPLRARAFSGQLRGLSAKAMRLLTSFDAIVVVPEGHASTFIREP